jgi:hypothetical protein
VPARPAVQHSAWPPCAHAPPPPCASTNCGTVQCMAPHVPVRPAVQHSACLGTAKELAECQACVALGLLLHRGGRVGSPQLAKLSCDEMSQYVCGEVVVVVCRTLAIEDCISIHVFVCGRGVGRRHVPVMLLCAGMGRRGSMHVPVMLKTVSSSSKCSHTFHPV